MKSSQGALMLAPMAGYTDSPFRQICRKLGADRVFTELISADGIVACKKKKDSGIFKEAKFSDDERPISIQLVGKDPEIVAEAAKIMLKRFKPDGIDINMGCPAKKVYRHGRGCALLADPKLMVEIAKRTGEIVKEAGAVFSVKTRLGIEDDNELLPIVGGLFDAGIDFLTVHARTYKDYFSGNVRLGALKRVVEVAEDATGVGGGRIVGNGNILSVKSANKMREETGVKDLAIGRGAVGNPWIFKSIVEGQDYFPSVSETADVVRMHSDLVSNFMEIRKHLAAYFKGLPGIKKYRLKLVTVETKEDVEAILKEIVANYKT